MARLKAVCPVSDEDTNALPVKDLGPAIGFYEAVLGFSVVGRSGAAPTLAAAQFKPADPRATLQEIR